jgi:hypothetical protein
MNPTSFESVFHRQNRRALRDALWPDEEVLATAIAGHGRPGLGVLALTTGRLLFLRTRLFRRPYSVSIPTSSIISVHGELVLGSGNVIVQTSGQTLKFVSIRPPGLAFVLRDSIEAAIHDDLRPEVRKSQSEN